MNITYKIDVEVERDSGMNTSRDDISDLIEQELSEVESNVSLSGLGPHSDSEYSVVNFEITQLDNKEQRAFNAEYDATVPAPRPTKSLEDEIRTLKANIKMLDLIIARKERELTTIHEERKTHATRIYQDNVGSGLPPTYFEDGPYDRVIFRYGEGEYDRFTVALKENKIEIRSDGMGVRDMGIFPRSGNEIMIGMVER